MGTVRKGITITSVLVVVGALVVVAIVFVSRIGGTQGPFCEVQASGTSTAPSGTSGANTPDHYSFSPEQAGNAATIAAVALKMNMPPHAVTIALATAWQESKLINLTSGDRDSAGLFQQRPSEGWGTYAQVTDPVQSTTAFYTHLNRISDWVDLPVTQAAQDVQHSAAPDAYAQWEDEARAMATALTGQNPAGLTCHNLAVNPTSADLSSVAANEWGGQVTGSHDAQLSWAMGSWLVAKATVFGVDKVTVGNSSWTSSSGDWSPAPGSAASQADPAVSLEQVQAKPTS